MISFIASRQVLVTLAVLAGVLATSRPAEADFITNHASTGANAVGWSFVRNVGATASHSDGSFQGHGQFQHYTGSGYSDARISANQGLQLSTSIQANEVTFWNMFSQWEDVIFLSNTNPSVVGQTLRLNFAADGFLNADSGGRFQVDLRAAYGSRGPMFGNHVTAGFDERNGFTASDNWNSITHNQTGTYSLSFDGTFSLDIDLTQPNFVDPANPNGPGIPGAYYIRLQKQFYAQGLNLSAGDPFTIQSITLPDVGNVTPESLGVTVSFDSGLQSPNGADPVPTPTPVPPSAMLFAAGALLAVARGLRRRPC